MFMINYGVHTCSSIVLFHVYKCYRWGREYHPTTFYNQLSMMRHNSAKFSRQKNAKTDLPTPMLALSMCLMPPDVTRTIRAASVPELFKVQTTSRRGMSCPWMGQKGGRRVRRVWLRAWRSSGRIGASSRRDPVSSVDDGVLLVTVPKPISVNLSRTYRLSPGRL